MAFERNDARPVSYTVGSSQVLQKDLLGTKDNKAAEGNSDNGQLLKDFTSLGEDRFVTDELTEVQKALSSVNYFAPQVAIQEPAQLYRGLIRYCKAPWDPMGTSYEGLVVYDGSAWTRLGLDYDADITSLQGQITANDGDISALSSGKADVSHTHAYTEVNNVTTARLLGRTTAATGAAELISVGAGLTLSSGTLSAGDQSKGVAVLRPSSGIYPTSNFPQLVSRNGHDALAFDTATQETIYFTIALPSSYVAQGLNVKLFFASDAVSGTGGFGVSVEALLGSDIDVPSFDTEVLGTPITVSATAGTVMQQTIALADGDLDGAGASEPIRLRIRRDVANDTAASDLQVVLVIVELQ